MIEELGATANLGPLRLAFPAAFTPQDRRGEMRNFKGPFSVHDFLQIHDYTPDVVTGNTTPEMRLDAFARMLFLPRTLSLTHEDHERALVAVCEQRGIDPSSLPMLKEIDRATFAAIHKEAGLFMKESMLQHARHSLVAVLHNDAQESAHGSIYTYATRIKDNPEEAAQPQLTERAHCTGSNLHDSLTQGIGLALQNNRDLVLHLMEITADPLQQLDVHQRESYDNLSNIVKGVKGRQGGFANPRMAEGNKQFAIKEITQELRGNIPSHYREMLQELLTIAQDIEIK